MDAMNCHYLYYVMGGDKVKGGGVFEGARHQVRSKTDGADATTKDMAAAAAAAEDAQYTTRTGIYQPDQ